MQATTIQRIRRSILKNCKMTRSRGGGGGGRGVGGCSKTTESRGTNSPGRGVHAVESRCLACCHPCWGWWVWWRGLCRWRFGDPPPPPLVPAACPHRLSPGRLSPPRVPATCSRPGPPPPLAPALALAGGIGAARLPTPVIQPPPCPCWTCWRRATPRPPRLRR